MDDDAVANLTDRVLQHYPSFRFRRERTMAEEVASLWQQIIRAPLDTWYYDDFDTAHKPRACLTLRVGPAADRIIERHYPGPQETDGVLRLQVARALVNALYAKYFMPSNWTLEVESRACILHVRCTIT